MTAEIRTERTSSGIWKVFVDEKLRGVYDSSEVMAGFLGLVLEELDKRAEMIRNLSGLMDAEPPEEHWAKQAIMTVTDMLCELYDNPSRTHVFDLAMKLKREIKEDETGLVSDVARMQCVDEEDVILSEGSFRRGFMHGYFEALENRQNGYSHDECYDHMEQNLESWRYGDRSIMEMPPRLEKKS